MNRRQAFFPMLSLIVGAACQAGNTVLVAAFHRALGNVNPITGLSLRLCVVFFPLALCGTVILSTVGKRHGIGLPSRKTRHLHAIRFLDGYVATACLFEGTILLKQQRGAIANGTLFSNSGSIVTACLALFDRRKSLKSRITDLVPASIGIIGLYVAVILGQPLVFNVATALLIGGCIGVGILALVMKELKTLTEESSGVRLTGVRGILFAIQVSTVFASVGGFVSLLILLISIQVNGGFNVSSDLVLLSVAAATCYSASQLFIQYGFSYTNPALTAPLMTLAVPIGYGLDQLAGLQGFSANHVLGTALIGLAALVSFAIAFKRSRSRH